ADRRPIAPSCTRSSTGRPRLRYRNAIERTSPMCSSTSAARALRSPRRARTARRSARPTACARCGAGTDSPAISAVTTAVKIKRTVFSPARGSHLTAGAGTARQGRRCRACRELRTAAVLSSPGGELPELEHRDDRERGGGDDEPAPGGEIGRAERVLEERDVDDRDQEADLPGDRKVEPAVRERRLEGGAAVGAKRERLEQLDQDQRREDRRSRPVEPFSRAESPGEERDGDRGRPCPSERDQADD